MRSPFISAALDRLFDLFAITAFAMGVAYWFTTKLVESKILLIAYLLTLLGTCLHTTFTAGQALVRQAPDVSCTGRDSAGEILPETRGKDHRVDAAEVLALRESTGSAASAGSDSSSRASEPPDVRRWPAVSWTYARCERWSRRGSRVI